VKAIWLSQYCRIGESAVASPTLIRAVKRDVAPGGLDRLLGSDERPCTVAYWMNVVKETRPGFSSKLRQVS
jgi:hypothetical protein